MIKVILPGSGEHMHVVVYDCLRPWGDVNVLARFDLKYIGVVHRSISDAIVETMELAIVVVGNPERVVKKYYEV